MAAAFDSNFSFNQQLWYYYTTNRGKIRSRYNDLTRKFLAYNDSEENPHAFLRKPQFEALEMYVFVKEFMNNKQVYEMFDDWRNRRDRFSDASYYAVDKGGQIRLFDAPTEKQTDTIFKQMKKYREDYPNYIYALTMGLGKTILMATCIFYEFLLAKKYPRDKRFCHNALVFAPDKTVLQSLREIMTFDKTKVVPPEYARVLDANIKFHFLDESGTILHTIDDSDFNIIISNTQKIIVKKKRKETTAAETLFSGSGSLLSAVYGTDSTDAEDDAWDDSTLMDNQRFKKLCRLPQLGVYVDEAHHLFGADLEKQIRSSGANKTSLRDTINLLAANTSIVACYNYTGTPYVKNQLLPEVVYAYGLRESIWNGFLKDADPIGYENVKSEEFLTTVVTTFWERYGGRIYDGLNPKLAIYAAGVEEAVTEVKPALERILAKLGVPASKILLNVGDAKYTKNDDIRDFNNLDVPGTEGNEKQFIILVEKGKEGWNCRSLFGVALFRSPKSKIFVLQATMRCLRAITDERLTATVFLSKENFDTLDDELHKNFNMEIKDRCQQRIFRKMFGRGGFALLDGSTRKGQRLTFRQLRQSLVLDFLVRLRIFQPSTVGSIQRPPAELLHRAALGSKLSTGALHRHCGFRIGMRFRHGAQQPQGHQLQHRLFTNRQAGQVCALEVAGGDHRMVVGHFLVIDDLGRIAGKLHTSGKGQRPSGEPDQLRQTRRHIRSQITAVRPGIGAELLFMDKMYF